MVVNAKSVLIVIALICFAIAVLVTAGAVSLGKIDWTDAGLFFGFLSFLV
jgi:1,4-dihydroxy-2-naphthoate octaprenyltransferase